MGYKIIRTDGKKDKNTSHYFNNYEDAYNLLKRIYGDLCCSDTDYENIIYYDIVENNYNKENNEE